MKARIFAGSFTPGLLSTPEETSTCAAPEIRIASATFSGLRPPESVQSSWSWARKPLRIDQSNALPKPPSRAAPGGGPRVEQEGVGAFVGLCAGEISARGDAERLHDGNEGVPFGEGCDIRRGFLPVQLDSGDLRRLVDQPVEPGDMGPPAML